MLSVRAQDLLAHFAVYGRFYEKSIAGVAELLRDRLEIAPPAWALADVVQRSPDLLVVMMNPGASRPLSAPALWDDANAQGFVATQPDRTQHQIMRLLLQARAYGLPWQHARVLNLSDLRTPKSAILIEKIKTYSSDDSHSIFSSARAAQSQALLADTRVPVLCAWGLHPALLPLADAALRAVAGHPLLGISDDARRYRHPLPQRHDLQLQWLAQLVAQLPPLAPANRHKPSQSVE